jgi:hypothetical protein
MNCCVWGNLMPWHESHVVFIDVWQPPQSGVVICWAAIDVPAGNARAEVAAGSPMWHVSHSALALASAPS